MKKPIMVEVSAIQKGGGIDAKKPANSKSLPAMKIKVSSTLC